MKNKKTPHNIGHKKEKTRQALVDAARKLFTERGYHSVGIRDFAAAAGVTRGAVYYYFPDKESVFLAVLDSIQQKRIDIATDRRLAPDRPDPWTELRRDLQIALDETMDKKIQRVLFIDGPSVLGWARWRELDSQYVLGIIIKVIENSLRRKLIVDVDPQSLAHLIRASVTEASMMICYSQNPTKTRIKVGQAVDAILSGLIKNPAD